MLHKAPAVLAAASGLFVVGVLAYTANDRFGDGQLQGQLVPVTSSDMATTGGDDGGPWLDPNNNMAPVDLATFAFTDTSFAAAGGVTGTTGGGSTGTTGGTTGGKTTGGKTAGTTAGAPPPPPPPDPCAPKAEKKLNGNEVCKCGTKADDLEAAYKTAMTKALNNVKAGACAAECPQDDSIDPNPTSVVNGPTITRTHVAGKGVKPNEDKKWKKAGCKLPELVACFTATGDAKSERFCKKKSSSSSTTSSSTSSSPSSTSSSTSSSPSSTSSSTSSSPSSTSSSSSSTSSSVPSSTSNSSSTSSSSIPSSSGN